MAKKKIRPQKTLTYDINDGDVLYSDGVGVEYPSVHIVIKISPFGGCTSEFRSGLEDVFKEILKEVDEVKN